MKIMGFCSPKMRKCFNGLLESHRLVMPVLINIFLTLSAWIGLYKMKVDDRLVEMLFGNSGLTMADALKNGLCSSLMLVGVCFIMLALALWDLKRLVQFWLYSSCCLLLFVVSGNFFYALFLGPDASWEDNPSWMEVLPVFVITAIYGTMGAIVYFTQFFPDWMHSVYVILNCSFISLYYLRVFPGYTAWVILVVIAFWDIFAVLSPYGPLNLVQSKAKDYGSDILRFLMYSTDTNDIEKDAESSVSSIKSVSSCCSTESLGEDGAKFRDSTSASSSIEVIDTAEDSLNDSTLKLGMGDFVFYSLLVGKSAEYGSCFATGLCILGIVYGLVATLFFFTTSASLRTIPALPISVFLGIGLHLLGLVFDPYISDRLHHLHDLLILNI